MNSNKNMQALRCGLLLTGIALLSAGIWRDEVTMIFLKAVNVCFQCIGIG